MRYLSGEDVLAIHHYILETTGGSHGVRDVGLFLSILEKQKQGVFGKELYAGVFTKAAALFEAFVNFHVFVDGNKPWFCRRRPNDRKKQLYVFSNEYRR